MCAVEDKFRRPAVPLRGHFPDDITGHPDGARRPQPGAARLQTPGQSAGSPSFGQHLPAHLHDRCGSTGRPLHDHVAGMVGGALPAEAPSQGNILTGGVWFVFQVYSPQFNNHWTRKSAQHGEQQRVFVVWFPVHHHGCGGHQRLPSQETPLLQL